MYSCIYGCRYKLREFEYDLLIIICIKVKIFLKCIYVFIWINICEMFRKKNNIMIFLKGNFCVKFFESSRDFLWVWIFVFVV